MKKVLQDKNKKQIMEEKKRTRTKQYVTIFILQKQL
jgi:hypothetical protein